jgi:two-component system, probable response regulator PhcQ
MTRILLVDDDPNITRALQREIRLYLRDSEVHIETYTNPFDALNRICVCDFDLVISDFTMPELSGVDLLQTLRDVSPNTVRIMLTASTEITTAIGAINQAQVFRFVQKPWQPIDLQDTIRAALAHRAALLAEAAPPLSPQEEEAQRLEAEEPGILQVRRTDDGSIIL